MNYCSSDGWDMEKVLKTLINHRHHFPNKMERKFAKILLSCLDYSENKEAFRIHSKGIGVVGIQGIKENDFITEYLGELYPPWRWFEK